MRKFTFLKYSFFGKRTVTVLSYSIILVEDLIRWGRGFEILFINHYAADIGKNSIGGKY